MVTLLTCQGEQPVIRSRPDFGHCPLTKRYPLAQDISVPPPRINEIVHGVRASTADTALRLVRQVGTSERFLLNWQARYNLEVHCDALDSRLPYCDSLASELGRQAARRRSQVVTVREPNK